MIKVKTILVPTDFSDCPEAAVKYGYALAETFGATIHLLNVVQDPNAMPWAAHAFAAPIGHLLRGWEAKATRRLVDTVPAASSAPTVLKTLVGSPYSAI